MLKVVLLECHEFYTALGNIEANKYLKICIYKFIIAAYGKLVVRLIRRHMHNFRTLYHTK